MTSHIEPQETKKIRIHNIHLELQMIGILTSLLETLAVEFSSCVDKDYLKLITIPLEDTIRALSVEPLTYKDVINANKRLLYAKTPLSIIHQEVMHTKDPSKILLVLVTHEMFNAVGRLFDALHALSHVDDKIKVSPENFERDLMEYLNNLVKSDKDK